VPPFPALFGKRGAGPTRSETERVTEERNAKLANLLIGIFLLILAGALIVDLITFWPAPGTHPQSVQLH
jgi:hypothetical protein